MSDSATPPTPELTASFPPFVEFPSIARLSREIIITEKIDGTNGCVHITDDGQVIAGSRSRWITPAQDNYGFAKWVAEHAEELRALGPGSHFGEWWGAGVQRRYGLTEKRFSLFNVGRWAMLGATLAEKQEHAPPCCHVVPVLRFCPTFDSGMVDQVLAELQTSGSRAAPGFMQPEGVVVFHVPSRTLFKKTLDKNDGHKSGGAR